MKRKIFTGFLTFLFGLILTWARGVKAEQPFYPLPPPEVTYQEWQEKYGTLPFQVEEIYKNERFDGQMGLLAVIINADLLWQITKEIEQYLNDLEIEGYSTVLCSVSGGKAEDLRNLLKNYLPGGLEGTIFIGDLPIAWRHAYDPYSDEFIDFPCDLFYEDLDGTWLDINRDGIYDHHTAKEGTDRAPEIYLGRLTASPLQDLGDEVALIRAYFQRNHQYRKSSPKGGRTKALYYYDPFVGEDPDSIMFEIGLERTKIIYSDVTVAGLETSSAEDYKKRIAEEAYSWLWLTAHSNRGSHFFGSGENRKPVTSDDIIKIRPDIHFYNLYCCGVGRYVEKNYLAGCYLFSNGLAAFAGVAGNFSAGYDLFYKNLANGFTLGQAWIEVILACSLDLGNNAELYYTYDLTLLGDPTLRLACPSPYLPEISLLTPENYQRIPPRVIWPRYASEVKFSWENYPGWQFEWGKGWHQTPICDQFKLEFFSIAPEPSPIDPDDPYYPSPPYYTFPRKDWLRESEITLPAWAWYFIILPYPFQQPFAYWRVVGKTEDGIRAYSDARRFFW